MRWSQNSMVVLGENSSESDTLYHPKSLHMYRVQNAGTVMR